MDDSSSSFSKICRVVDVLTCWGVFWMRRDVDGTTNALADGSRNVASKRCRRCIL